MCQPSRSALSYHDTPRLLRDRSPIRYASWVDVSSAGAAGASGVAWYRRRRHDEAARPGPRARSPPFFSEAATMTAPNERPQDGPHAVPPQDPRGEVLPDPVAMPNAVERPHAYSTDFCHPVHGNVAT